MDGRPPASPAFPRGSWLRLPIVIWPAKTGEVADKSSWSPVDQAYTRGHALTGTKTIAPSLTHDQVVFVNDDDLAATRAEHCFE
jgi:hypothetical protein